MGPGFESLKVHHKVGVFNAEGTPVPIPNTEVKLCSGDNTRLETAREDNTMPTQYADLAHLVERDLAKVEVAGSSPVIRSKRKHSS